jgi:hypothetical protein
MGNYAGDQDQGKDDAERPDHRFNSIHREAVVGLNTSANKQSRNIHVSEWSLPDILPEKIRYRSSFWPAQPFLFDSTGCQNHSQSPNHQSRRADSNYPIQHVFSLADLSPRPN